MTSIERHEGRYQRRKQIRYQKMVKRNEGATLENVASFNNLRKAYYASRKGVGFKASVQKYGANIMKNSLEMHEKMMKGEDVTKGFNEFDVFERGKKRHIMSVHISERVAQKSLCDNALVPVIEKSFIYGNMASQKGKGTLMAIERISNHLHKHFQKHGTEGYILLIDAHNFFGSIDKKEVYKQMDKWILDKRIVQLTKQFLDPFPEGLGLGSQVCQICAVGAPNQVDHMVTDKLHIRLYGRYMDDSYLIHENKEFLKNVLEVIRTEYRKIGIELNEKKTKIVKLSRGFEFLKTKFFITGSGKVLRKITRENVTKQRRKLKKLKKLLDAGKISYSEVRQEYASWKGYAKHKTAYWARKNMDELYNSLFIRNWRIANEIPVT